MVEFLNARIVAIAMALALSFTLYNLIEIIVFLMFLGRKVGNPSR